MYPSSHSLFKDIRNAQMQNSHSYYFPFRLQGTNGNQQSPISTATVSMVHSVPELMVSSEVSHMMTIPWMNNRSTVKFHCVSVRPFATSGLFEVLVAPDEEVHWINQKKNVKETAMRVCRFSPHNSKPNSWPEKTSRDCTVTKSWSSWWTWTRRWSTPLSSTASACPTRYRSHLPPHCFTAKSRDDHLKKKMFASGDLPLPAWSGGAHAPHAVTAALQGIPGENRQTLRAARLHIREPFICTHHRW